MKRTWKTLPLMVLTFALAACGQQPSDTKKENQISENKNQKSETKSEKAYQDFRNEMEDALDNADKKIETLVSKAKNASAETKAKIYDQISNLYQERSVVRKKMKELRVATAENWEDVKGGVQSVIKDLQVSLKESEKNISITLDQATESEETKKAREAFEKFKKEMQKTIDASDEKVEDLLAEVKKASKEGKAELFEQISSLYEKRSRVRKKMKELQNATVEGWEELQEGVNQTVQELDKAVNAAWKKLKAESS